MLAQLRDLSISSIIKRRPLSSRLELCPAPPAPSPPFAAARRRRLAPPGAHDCPHPSASSSARLPSLTPPRGNQTRASSTRSASRERPNRGSGGTERAAEPRKRRNREGGGTKEAAEPRGRRNRDGGGTERAAEPRERPNRGSGGTERAAEPRERPNRMAAGGCLRAGPGSGSASAALVLGPGRIEPAARCGRSAAGAVPSGP